MTNVHFRTHLLMDSRHGNNNLNSPWFGQERLKKRPRGSVSLRGSGRGHPGHGAGPKTAAGTAGINPLGPAELEPLITDDDSSPSLYKSHVSRALRSTIPAATELVRGEHRPSSAATPVGSPAGDYGLGHVTQDCFIIPVHCVHRFMPLPLSDLSSRSLSMMQLDNPNVCIVLDFMEGLKPLSPTIPTMVSAPHPLSVQLGALKETAQKVNAVGSALEGMILMNMEANSEYPFISYMVVNTNITDPHKFMMQYHSIMVEHFEPRKIHHIGDHSISVYEEVATIARPPIDLLPKKPSSTKTGYIITVFKVFPGDDREKLERSWLTWTGARMTYKYLPKCLGLKRITFHKKLWPNGGITYVFLCECSSLMDHIAVGCGFVEQLRVRCCGYTGLYKIVEHF